MARRSDLPSGGTLAYESLAKAIGSMPFGEITETREGESGQR